MNTNFYFVILLVISLLSNHCTSFETKKSDTNTTIIADFHLEGLKGSYLGQKPPGDVPKLFAPGVVADIFREHSSAAFTPDGKEVFWTRQIHTMTKEGQKSRLVVAMHMKQVNGVWIKPALASFNDGRWTFITCISPDGKKIFFESLRPINGEDEHRGIWVVDKTEDGWGEPKLFSKLDKWEISYSKLQVVKSGNIYFQSKYPKPNLKYESWGVGFFCSKLVNGEYQKPFMLDSTINTANYLDYGFWVDPNEEFILFCSSRPGGYSELDLYISYQKTDGSWGKAINLGEKINTHGMDGSDWPFLSPDGKYLFFMTSMRPKDDVDKKQYTYQDCIESQLSITNPDSKIHWVSARFIDELMSKN